MAEAANPVSFRYDEVNDVMRVFLGEPDEDQVAVPSPSGSVILVSPNLDRVIGIVFDHFLPTMRESAPEQLQALDDSTFIEAWETMLYGLAPTMLEGAGLRAKDQVAKWIEIVGIGN